MGAARLGIARVAHPAFVARRDAGGGEARQLPGEATCYKAADVSNDEDAAKSLDATCIAPKELLLKPGAQVMLLRNVDATHVNGSRGIVKGMDKVAARMGAAHP